MSNEFESMAKILMSSPQGSKILTGLDKFSAIMATESGRQLIEMLAGPGGDALKAAATAAHNSGNDHARVLLTVLISSKDGAALVAKVVEAIGV